VDVDETIQVRCPRCKDKFRDRARRVRDGYSRQCPSCERMLFFLDGSPNKDISDALRSAERTRKLLRQAEDEQAMRPAASAAPLEGEESEAVTVSRRIDRRVRGPGRTMFRSR
jgi:predicted  nucleic acid-binding Zn-ribbon protein